MTEPFFDEDGHLWMPVRATTVPSWVKTKIVQDVPYHTHMIPSATTYFDFTAALERFRSVQKNQDGYAPWGGTLWGQNET